MSSSDSSSSTSSSDSEKEKKRKKRKRKMLSNSSSSNSDSTDSSSSSSSDSSISDEKRKRRRKKKTVGKKRKKAKRARTKKKRRRKMSTDSSSSDSDPRIKKKKKIKKKIKEAKSINNGDISKIISKSPASDETKILHSETSIKKVKEEIIAKDKKITDEIISTRKTITGMNVHDNECMKQWEVDSMITLQPSDDESSQDHTSELGKMDSSEKSTYRRKKKKRSRDMQERDRSSKERIQEGKERSDEELEVKRKKRKEKDIRSSTEFLADWEREGERINQQIIQNEIKFSKKLEKKQKKEKWGETDFDTLNVPSLTQLEKEVCQKQLLADEWEVDSLEAMAITDLTVSKRKSNQSISKKMEKEVRYDEKTDTYIAIEKESAKEMKKRQERLCAIRIWEEEQEEGEKEEMMLLKQKSKHKKDDWDIEEESFLCKNEEIEICNDIVGIEKEWIKSSEDTSVKENSNKEIKLESIGSKRVRKSRWDMGSHSEEKSETKDIWEEEYPEWSKINKYEQKHEEMEKED